MRTGQMTIKHFKGIIAILCILLFNSLYAHEAHYTYTHLKFDLVNDSIHAEITFKTDDLMSAMDLKMLYKLNVSDGQLTKDDVRMIFGYIANGFNISVDGQPVLIEWLSGNFKDAGMRIKIKAHVDQFDKAKGVVITNTLLDEMGGRNMVILKMKNFEQGWLFDNKTKVKELDMSSLK